MKTIHFLKKLTVSILLIFGTSVGVKAQSEVIDFIKGGIADGEALIQGYLEPLGNAMGANLNGGWYNTAKVHNTLGFDITLTLTAAFPPESAKTFDLAALGLIRLELKDPTNSIAPTFAGSLSKGPWLLLRDPESGIVLVEFEAIGGLNVPLYPLPMVKGAVGLPKGFEIMGRFIPKFTFEDISLGMWGAGVKYDFLQHIPVVNNVPFLNASVMGAYTSISSSAGVDFQKSIYGQEIEGIPIVGGLDHYDNQKLQLKMQGFTAMLLVSYDLPVITFYGGLGFSRAMTNVDLFGDYPLLSGLGNESDEQIIRIEEIIDPISLEFKNHSGFQSTIGLRLKLAVVTLHVDYTLANYNMVSAGLGFSFR